MKGAAKRAAVKFTLCAALVVFGGVAIPFAGSPYKVFLYVLAIGVCVKLAWPSQEEGDALIAEVENDRSKR